MGAMNSFGRLIEPEEIASLLFWAHRNPVINGSCCTPTSDSGSADMRKQRLQERRERVFIVLAGTFLCAMTLLNVIGITRFVQFGPMALAVGVLPYPLTFLCTDLICELYGKARANFLVSVGLGLNFLILFVLFLGNSMPAVPAESMPPWQVIQLAAPVALPNGESSRAVSACTS
jgi:hypothetical protein